MTRPLPETVAAFIDWPNIERSIRSHFRGLSHQDVARIVIYAIEVVSERIGALQSASAYADWRTAYSEAVPVLAANYRFNPILVPRKASGGDRCDTTIVADIVDFTHERNASPKPAILLCAGDADYAVAARRALERGFEVHVTSVSSSLAPELRSLTTAVYPLERYFLDAARHSGIQLTPNIRDEDLPSLAEVRKWAGLIRLLDRLTRNLDYVTFTYFARRLSETRPRYGASRRESRNTIEAAVNLGIARYAGRTRNPQNPRNSIQTIELSRDSILVRCVLENIKVPSDKSPDTPLS